MVYSTRGRPKMYIVFLVALRATVSSSGGRIDAKRSAQRVAKGKDTQ